MRGPQRQNVREQIAQEAARLMVEHGIRDYRLAKRKALSSLLTDGSGQLPTNREVEHAVDGYLRMFHADSQPERLRGLRRQALGAMRVLADFEPHLVGSVLAGTADAHSQIGLHVYADPAELVNLFLDESGFRFVPGEARLQMSSNVMERFPTCLLAVDGDEIEIVVFSRAQRVHAPVSVVDGRPMRRAGIGKVAALLEDSG